MNSTEDAYRAFPISFQHDLERESWALYALGVLVIGIRMYARVRKMSWRGLEIDDYLMLLAALWYTLLIVTLNLTASGGGSALAMPGEDVMALPEWEIKVREKGAKIGFVAEQSMLNVIWTLKVCMLLLYNRLTMGLKQQLGVKVLAVYVALGYVACQLAIFCECIPFSTYWQVAPSPSRNCMVYFDYLIVQAITNISSDVFMMLIPLPLILTVSVPVKQKAILLVIFSMGIFVIVAATLTKVEFFISIYSDDFMFWYTREASVAVYVANLPCIWPLLREALPVLRSWTPGFVSSNYKRTHRHGTSTGPMTRGAGVTTRTNVTRRSLDEFQKIVDTPSHMTKSALGSQVSEVHSYHQRVGIEGGDCNTSDSASDDSPFHGIRAHTTIEMSVMTPDGHGQSSRRTSCDDAQHHRLGQSHHSGSNGDWDFDLEKGSHVPRSSV